MECEIVVSINRHNDINREQGIQPGVHRRFVEEVQKQMDESLSPNIPLDERPYINVAIRKSISIVTVNEEERYYGHLHSSQIAPKR